MTQKYRIVCLYPSDTFTVQERMSNGEWMEAHRCLNHNRQGLEEAQQWIKDKEEEL